MRAFSSFVLLLLTAGCSYTFRVPATVNEPTIAIVGKSNHAIVLVMDQAYREFKSTDRGHSVADNQTYEIGPALAELTEHYFKRAFASVTILERGESISETSIDFLIQPSMTHFDNEITMFPTRQTLDVQLSATVSTPRGVTIGSVQGSASDTHSIAFLRDDEERISSILGAVIQKALSKLVHNVIRLIESSAVSLSPRGRQTRRFKAIAKRDA